MADLIFTIKTPAELKGVQDAITGFENAKGKALAAGKAVDEYDAKIARAKASIQAYNATQAQAAQTASAVAAATGAQNTALGQELDKTKDAAKETKKLTLSKEELKKIVTSLAQQFPLLGLAGRFALNPIVGAVLAFTYVLNRSREDYQKFRAELQQQANLEGLKGPINAVKEAIKGAKDETGKFFTELGKAATAERSLATAADAAITALEKQNTLARDLAEAYKNRALAELKFQKATGQITPEQYDEKVLETENAFAGRNQQRQDDLEKRTINELREKFGQADTDRQLVAPQIAPAIAEANEAEERAKNIVENKERARKNLREQNALIAGTKDQPGLQDLRDQLGVEPDDAEALSKIRSVDEFDQRSQYEQLPSRRTVKARRWVEKNLALEAAREKQAGLAAKSRELESQSEPSAQSAEQLRARADALKTKLEQLEADANALEKQIKQVETDRATAKPYRDVIERVNRDTRGVEAEAEKERAYQAEQRRLEPELFRSGGSGVTPATPVAANTQPVVPDMAGEFAAYHKQNVELVNGLIEALRTGKRQLADVSQRSRELMNT